MADDVFVHPQAINDCLEVGVGTKIWAFAHVLAGAKVGANCNICERVFIEKGAAVGEGCTIKNGVSVWEGVTLEDYVFVGPDVTFTNDRWPRSTRNPLLTPRTDWLEPTRICEGASLGARSVVVCGVTIGAYAMIAAGAVVTRDVAPHALVLGAPARQVGWVCICGHRLHESFSCPSCDRRYTLSEDVMKVLI
ncbi:MAG: UDP-2-acetamido-3-amino-2,3-dideoxy-glucuronate N-acetyltransferase [Kiritimatiellia bacterium]|jgi:UDP-2-acetamido-3-amino-2,3-dideoxy-glucuronate N-acetyltransferase